MANVAGKGMEVMKQVIKRIQQEGFDIVLKNVEFVSCADGKCSAKFKVDNTQVNAIGGLHGGFTATLLDNITTYALISKGAHPGVSVDLHVSYLKGAKEGDSVLVDATTVRAGKNLAYIECELRQEQDGSVIAKGSQTKYIGFGEFKI